MPNPTRWLRQDRSHPIDTWTRIGTGSWKGAIAGLAGVAAMTATEKVEQRFTGRPNSYMPAHTLERLLRLPQRPDDQRRLLNVGMHVGQGILLGVWRGVMAEGGLRGWRTSTLFTVLRLANDQTLENITGQGAPPWTWPKRELAVDLAHKVVYAFSTGLVADRLANATPAWIEARQFQVDPEGPRT